MTNAQLADRLNAELGLTGPDAVTANVIRQWVAWDVLPKAQVQGRSAGKGPIWIRSRRAHCRAVRLAELRKAGVRRENAVIVQAYIEWGHPDFERVRSALCKEFAKWRNQLNRRHITLMEGDNYRELSVTKKDAISNQIGRLDERFVGTRFQQSRELYGNIANFSRTSEGDQKLIEELIHGAFDKISPDYSKYIPDDFISILCYSVSGLTGSSEEIVNSGKTTIASATEWQFRIARYFVRCYLRMLQAAGRISEISELDHRIREPLKMLTVLAPEISVGPWLTSLFVQALHGIFTYPELGQRDARCPLKCSQFPGTYGNIGDDLSP